MSAGTPISLTKVRLVKGKAISVTELEDHMVVGSQGSHIF
jgi:hypothetical protein